jgi:hypothetical protein
MFSAGITSWYMLIDVRRQTVADKVLKVVVLHDPSKKFEFTTLEGIPPRKKRFVWFGIFALLFIISILGGGASRTGKSANPSPLHSTGSFK